MQEETEIPEFDFVNKTNMNMLTDLYELTMCASLFANKCTNVVTFDLFIRKKPETRSYFICCGLEQVLLYLKNVKFHPEESKYLRKLGFRGDFLTFLETFKFSGEVWAIPEGTIVFPNEPLLRVTAPIIEAQLIETFLLNTVNLQTMIASKASRVVNAAKGKRIVEFGLRRAHGTDAGMKAARCSYLAGCAGSSNALAGMKYGIPIFGTMAHSFIMFFDKEIEAFEAFVSTFPEKSTLLIDTYDDLKAAKKAVHIAKELEKKGFRLNGIRLDSGDLVAISQKIRKIFDERGLNYVKIFASGDLDEYKIEELLTKGAKIDAFGVGTRMTTSEDRPYVDVVYKLCEKMGKKGKFRPKMKLSKDKQTLPGRKQVFRIKDNQGYFIKDIIGTENEKIKGEPLLVKVIEKGQLVYNLPVLEDVRTRSLENLKHLPAKYKRLRKAPVYPVELSFGLNNMVNKITRELKG